MKRSSLYILLAATVVGVAVIAFGVAIWQYRGFLPLLREPPQNIADLIDGANTSKPSDDPQAQTGNTTEMPLELAEGVSISVFARDLENPRVLGFDPSGRLLASVPSQGRIVVLEDADQDGRADDVRNVVSGLRRPHGFDFLCVEADCQLYVGESDALTRFDYDLDSAVARNREVLAPLPDSGRHWTKSVLVYPEGDKPRILVSIGSSCDTCVEQDARRGTVQSYALDGSDRKAFSVGLRNAVFLARHPETGEVWVTEMGRDFLGDDLPPDEINVLEEGANFGWPYCYGNRVRDTEFDAGERAREFCRETVPAEIELQAHSAPLGLTFAPEVGWGDTYAGDLFVAYHGSWNRSVPTEYKIVRFDFENGELQDREDFVSGWLSDEGVLGRPSGIASAPNGVLYVADDRTGLVYRVHINSKQ